MLNPFDHFKGEETCPYCWERFQLSATPFRCASAATRCAPEVDPVLSEMWDESSPISRVIPPCGRFVKEATCSRCNGPSRKRLCPKCHQTLPATVGECRNYIIAFIGAKYSGKSHYFASLVEHFKKHVGPHLDLRIDFADQPTIDRYRGDFFKPLFEQKSTIDGTKATVGKHWTRPLIFSLRLNGKDLLGRKTIKNAVTLVFYDTAGEDLKSYDVMEQVNRYIFLADGLIVLLDPLQINTVRDALDPSSLPEKFTEPEDILTFTADLIRAGRNLGPRDLIQTPIAVAFSKFDAVDRLLDPQLSVLSASDHSRGFNVADSAAVNGEMRGLLAHWGQQSLLQQIDTHFRYHSFFGLSALGCNPHGTNRVPRVLPRRVEDPFLWLLHHHGLVKADR